MTHDSISPRRTRTLKQTGRLGRAVVIAIVGWSFGLAGVAGEAQAQSGSMRKDAKTMMKDEMKHDAGMKPDGGLKQDDAKVDEKAMPKDDKMRKDEKAMEKKPQ